MSEDGEQVHDALVKTKFVQHFHFSQLNIGYEWEYTVTYHMLDSLFISEIVDAQCQLDVVSSFLHQMDLLKNVTVLIVQSFQLTQVLECTMSANNGSENGD